MVDYVCKLRLQVLQHKVRCSQFESKRNLLEFGFMHYPNKLIRLLQNESNQPINIFMKKQFKYLNFFCTRGREGCTCMNN